MPESISAARSPGRSPLKLDYLLDILDVLQVHPLEFFRLIFPTPEKRSLLMARLASLFNPPGKAIRP